MRETQKSWLLTRMRSSGSQRRYLMNGRYADVRNGKQACDFEDLPNKEPLGNTGRTYRGKIDYGPLIRFLGDRVGQDWDATYSEIRSRIPKKLLAYEDSVLLFVATKVGMVDGTLINLETQGPIWMPNVDLGDWCSCNYDYSEFYVDPITNLLVRIQGSPFKQPRKKLGKKAAGARKQALQAEAKANQAQKDAENLQLLDVLKSNKAQKKLSRKLEATNQEPID